MCIFNRHVTIYNKDRTDQKLAVFVPTGAVTRKKELPKKRHTFCKAEGTEPYSSRANKISDKSSRQLYCIYSTRVERNYNCGAAMCKSAIKIKS